MKRFACKGHLVSKTNRPLCQATAFHRYGREDLGGFNLSFFIPELIDLEDASTCKRCLKTASKPNVTLQQDGKYLVDDPWFDALTDDCKEQMKAWDKLTHTKDKTEFYQNLKKAKAELKGRARIIVLSWFSQAKRKFGF